MKRVQPTIMQPQHNTIMRRVIQPRESNLNSVQMNTVNKISNLSNVSVTSSNSTNQQPRVRQTIYASQLQQNIKCFICDENIMGAPTSLKETETSTSREKVTKKLARLVGDEFCVIVSEEDVICRRCLTLFNTMDKYESDIQNVKSRLRGFINKKYGIEEQEEPPVKIQRLNDQSPGIHNSSNSYRWQNNNAEESPTRKIAAVNKETAESQLKTLSNTAKRGPVKLYKCIACDFKTTDLNAFQPHSSVCKGQQTKQSPIISPQNRVNRVTAYPQQQQQKTTLATQPQQQQVGRTTIVRNNTSQQPMQSCQQCDFKTADRNLFMEHQRNHMKLRPFKCRMCLERFATREAAQAHAKIHSSGMKCGICSRQFVKREAFEMHMKTHEKFKSVSQQEVIVMNKSSENAGTIQKPLTDIIKEALSEEDQDTVNEFIEFHSCNLCSLTFVNKKLYAQHMKTHETASSGKGKVNDDSTYIKGKSQITEGDLESIFEKMHSENATISNGSNGNENILITTTQDSGGFTYNITIPQDDVPQDDKKVRIDMPNLTDDGGDEKMDTKHHHAPVSMPSLHDDENTQSSQEQHASDAQHVEGEQGQAIPMDLEELQGADGQQLKFIVDENGQFLQLDNHILTTDAEGNQILVQGTNQEQLQHLLQSVGVDGNQVLVQLQGNGEGIDAEGATLQFGDGAQGQMILVQNENGESQLIDASMLQTEGGNLVLQQGADGETTLTTADGIPVSVSFSGEGADGQITVTMAGTGEDGQQIFIQQPVELAEGQEAQVQSEGEAMQLEGENSQEMPAVTETEASTENEAVASEEKTSEEASTAAEAESSQLNENEGGEIVAETESANEEKKPEVEASEKKVEEENKEAEEEK
ncbi:hypothetical protein PVAND_008880 [Polypedilum vanderplanki]|uniref:C2H2-type domain-containing protein n=1 Tax=Polypedilum vanderplanki TaxID=319348 RepID=A0A9J6CCF2_POLVA|nr:hypothetical protein PVAND_008880 [Polypedilum vanderplanki]